jgi:hypothetical protein
MTTLEIRAALRLTGGDVVAAAEMLASGKLTDEINRPKKLRDEKRTAKSKKTSARQKGAPQTRRWNAADFVAALSSSSDDEEGVGPSSRPGRGAADYASSSSSDEEEGVPINQLVVREVADGKSLADSDSEEDEGVFVSKRRQRLADDDDFDIQDAPTQPSQSKRNLRVSSSLLNDDILANILEFDQWNQRQEEPSPRSHFSFFSEEGENFGWMGWKDKTLHLKDTNWVELVNDRPREDVKYQLTALSSTGRSDGANIRITQDGKWGDSFVQPSIIREYGVLVTKATPRLPSLVQDKMRERYYLNKALLEECLSKVMAHITEVGVVQNGYFAPYQREAVVNLRLDGMRYVRGVTATTRRLFHIFIEGNTVKFMENYGHSVTFMLARSVLRNIERILVNCSAKHVPSALYRTLKGSSRDMKIADDVPPLAPEEIPDQEYVPAPPPVPGVLSDPSVDDATRQFRATIFSGIDRRELMRFEDYSSFDYLRDLQEYLRAAGRTIYRTGHGYYIDGVPKGRKLATASGQPYIAPIGKISYSILSSGEAALGHRENLNAPAFPIAVIGDVFPLPKSMRMGAKGNRTFFTQWNGRVERFSYYRD